MTGTKAHRARTWPAAHVGVAAVVCAVLACPVWGVAAASAAQPAKLLKLRDSDQSARRADNFDLPTSRDVALGGDSATTAYSQRALLDEATRRPAPTWPQSGQESDEMGGHVLLSRNLQRDRPARGLGWGLAGTGASIFTGALLYHIESLVLQEEYDALPARAHGRQYRELRNQIDQTRKFVLTLYAVGGSMVTGGVVLLATDDHNGEGVQAKLGPTWMRGGPAARLKVSF